MGNIIWKRNLTSLNKSPLIQINLQQFSKNKQFYVTIFYFYRLIMIAPDKVVDANTALQQLEQCINKIERKLTTLTREVSQMKSLCVTLRAGFPTTSPNATSSNTKLLVGSKRTFSEIEDDSLDAAFGSIPLEPQDNVPHGQFIRDGDLVVVYTDGACENNGKSNARAGIGVWFGHGHPLNVSKPVTGKATNNTAEIQACTIAITTAHKTGVKKLKIRTDSMFVINAMTQWIVRWKKNSWKLSTGGEVKNKGDFVNLDTACRLLEKVEWEHVNGHQGIVGNEAADKLARDGALRYYKSNNA